MATATRAQLLKRYHRLQARGLSVTEIAKREGKAYSSISNLLADPDGSKQRARRETYRGECVDCGAKTDGSSGKERAAIRCAACSKIHVREEQLIWSREKILECIAEWFELHGAAPYATDWLYNREPYRDGHRRWPHVACVQREFGSWANAIEVAGFPRPYVGGYPRSEESRRKLSEARTIWTPERIIEHIRKWEREHGSPPRNVEWTPWMAKHTGRPELAEQFYATGPWPVPQTLRARFGSFNAAIRAAGFEPRAPGGQRGVSHRASALKRNENRKSLARIAA